MYTIDVNAEEPIMLLNKQIGCTYNKDGYPDGTPYIDGAQFQEELMWLDSMGKKRIQVWVNCPGGKVMEAMNIFSAILKSKTPVDTYNVGIAASSGALVFMAGRKRIMADYAKLMIHNVSGGDEDPNGAKAFNDSCSKMLSAKSDLSEITTSYLMGLETWIGADDCLTNGICTSIESTKENNTKHMPTSDLKAMLAFTNSIVETNISKLKQPIMVHAKITNRLNLVEGASEDIIVSAINQLESDKQAAEERVTTAESALEETKTKLAEAEAELLAAKEATEAAEKEAADVEATSNATEMVNSFKAKLGDDTTVLSKWVNKAKVDFDGTKELLESLPLNKVSNRIPTGSEGGKRPLAVVSIMQEIQNRIKGIK